MTTLMRGAWSLKTRQLIPEVMDQPDLDRKEHIRALSALGRINWLSNSSGILWPAIHQLARESQRPIRLLDVATGGGDVPIRLWRKARQHGLPLEVTGCDRSTTAISHATSCARENQAAVTFFQLDALTDPLPDDQDILSCSLFLHHLDEEQAISLLQRMSAAARQLVLVNDLRRCFPGLVAAHLAGRALSLSPVVHNDAPQSVRAAFTLDEARQLAVKAGLTDASVERRWPWRMLLTWRRS